ncbi:MAG: C2H2-type zinc finger protein [Nitrososphaeraceae archaeon]
MNIKLDLSFVPLDLRSSIMRSIKTELSSQDNLTGNTKTKMNSMTFDKNENRVAGLADDTDQLYIIRWINGSLKDFKLFVENILRDNYDEYMVAEDTEAINTLTILKQGDVEQFGMYMCSHCGTFFKSTEERTVHERIHYFM